MPLPQSLPQSEKRMRVVSPLSGSANVSHADEYTLPPPSQVIKFAATLGVKVKSSESQVVPDLFVAVKMPPPLTTVN